MLARLLATRAEVLCARSSTSVSSCQRRCDYGQYPSLASRGKSPAPSMYGFTRTGAAAQKALERRFDGQLDAAEICAWLNIFRPRPITSARRTTRRTRNLCCDHFKSGAGRRDRDVRRVFPTPKRVALDSLRPNPLPPVCASRRLRGRHFDPHRRSAAVQRLRRGRRCHRRARLRELWHG